MKYLIITITFVFGVISQVFVIPVQSDTGVDLSLSQTENISEINIDISISEHVGIFTKKYLSLVLQSLFFFAVTLFFYALIRWIRTVRTNMEERKKGIKYMSFAVILIGAIILLWILLAFYLDVGCC